MYSGGIYYLTSKLKEKLHQLLLKYKELQRQNQLLEEELVQTKQKIEQTQQEVYIWQQKYQAIKVADTIVKSNQDKTETKYKINSLIRQIDYCISELSK